MEGVYRCIYFLIGACAAVVFAAMTLTRMIFKAPKVGTRFLSTTNILFTSSWIIFQLLGPQRCGVPIGLQSNVALIALQSYNRVIPR